MNSIACTLWPFYQSNASLERYTWGDKGRDLLVRRRDAQRFAETLSRLGFKEARLASNREVPGALHRPDPTVGDASTRKRVVVECYLDADQELMCAP